jgi:hypothetical protein
MRSGNNRNRRNSRNRQRGSRNRNSSVAASPPLKSEQVAGHSSVDKSSDGDAVICAICYETITTQQVGKPDVCKHIFCLECIKEWASYNNICPLDQKKFKYVFTRRHRKVEKFKYGEKPQRLEYCFGMCSSYKILTILLIIMVALCIILLCNI